MNSGIYQIINIVNGNTYIGSAVDFNVRWKNHIKLLRKGNHHSIHLQRAWNIYGESSFKFQILFTCIKEELLSYEQYFINKESPAYNICRNAGSTLGVKLSDNTKLKMSIAGIGRQFSAETREKLKEKRAKQIFSKESRIKMSTSQSRRVHSTATKEKLSAINVGENNHNSKLTITDVFEIRKIYNEFGTRISLISRMYSVNWSTIKRIVTGDRWARV